MSNLSVVLSVLAHLPSVTEAHAYVGFPLGRNAFEFGCRSNCNRAGGEFEPQSSIWQRGKDTDTTCGVLFSEYNQTPWDQWEVQTTIRESTFKLDLYFAKNHGGNHHLNFVCMDGRAPGTLTSSIPIGEWEWLTRASDDRSDSTSHTDYPSEFFVPQNARGSRFISNTQFTSGGNKQSVVLKATSRWNSPSKPCNHGILRWSWETDNSCISNRFQTRSGQPRMTKAQHKEIYPSAPNVGLCANNQMERYINCADVRFTGRGVRGSTAGQNGGRTAGGGLNGAQGGGRGLRGQGQAPRALDADVDEDELVSIPTYAKN